MRRRGLSWRHAAVTVVITLAVAAGYLLLRDTAPVAALEAQTLDWRFRLRGPMPPPESVAIVAIDDATIAYANAWPLPRRMIADAVARVDSAGATVIGLDLLFLEPEPPSDGQTLGPGDHALREALADADQPVLGMAFTFGPAPPPGPGVEAAVARSAFRVVHRESGVAASAILRADGALVPNAALADGAALGHVNVPADAGGALRSVAMAIGFGDFYMPGFPVALATRHLGLAPDQLALQLGQGVDLGPRFVPSDARLRLVLNYYGPAATLTTVSMREVLEGRVAPETFAGRAVLFGATALGVGDSFATPYDGTLPGVEVLATATANLISGQAIARTDRTALADLSAILLLGLAAFLLLQIPSPLLAAGAGVALLAGWSALAQVAFQSQLLWLDMTFPSLAILLNGAWIALGRLVFERQQRGVAERQRGNLSRYHSPLIADFLAEGGAASLAGDEQPAAILFIDIAGFTARSERLGPTGTAGFLRDFHGRVEQAVLRHGGVLDQFAGDGAMVIFGVPRPGPQDAAAALGCGRDLMAAVEIWNRELVGAGQPPVEIGIGIHYGPVVIARLGGLSQMQLSAAGDTVNLASRLEALTRSHHASIVVSDALAGAVQALGRRDLLSGFEEVAAQAIRGRNEPVGVWILRRPPT